MVSADAKTEKSKDVGTGYLLNKEEENELVKSNQLILKNRQTSNFKVGDRMSLLGEKGSYLVQVKNTQPHYQPFGIDISVILIEEM